MVFNQGAPLRNRLRLRLPALSFWPGHKPAHATKWPAVAKRLMSRPISERIVSAESRLTPGIVTSKRIKSRNPGLGSIRSSRRERRASASRSICRTASSSASYCRKWSCNRKR